MNLYEKYGLTPVINACGKQTNLSNSRVPSTVADTVRESLGYFFDANELQELVSRKIAGYSGTEAGFITNSSASAITLAASACMTRQNLSKVLQLPDTTGMKNEIVIQKGHIVNFGASVTQMVRLSGARVKEIGTVNGTHKDDLWDSIGSDTAAVLFVVSQHTIHSGCISLVEVVRIAHDKNIPVIVDAAAQGLILKEIVSSGADIVITSSHKYLSSTVSGMVCGREDLIRAMRLQNQGIGRTMKVGKEGIFGLLSALENTMLFNSEGFYSEMKERVKNICKSLSGYEGIRAESVDDQNGNPFCRARIHINSRDAGIDAFAVCTAAASATPSVRLRDFYADEGFFDIDVVEPTGQELEVVINTIKRILELPIDRKSSLMAGRPKDQKFLWLNG